MREGRREGGRREEGRKEGGERGERGREGGRGGRGRYIIFLREEEKEEQFD